MQFKCSAMLKASIPSGQGDSVLERRSPTQLTPSPSLACYLTSRSLFLFVCLCLCLCLFGLRFAAIMNVSLPQGGEDALRSAMDELFDAAVVHVSIDYEDEGHCGLDGGECGKGSNLVRDSRYIAAQFAKELHYSTYEEIATAWEAVKSCVSIDAPEELAAPPRA